MEFIKVEGEAELIVDCHSWNNIIQVFQGFIKGFSLKFLDKNLLPSTLTQQILPLSLLFFWLGFEEI